MPTCRSRTLSGRRKGEREDAVWDEDFVLGLPKAEPMHPHTRMQAHHTKALLSVYTETAISLVMKSFFCFSIHIQATSASGATE